MKIKLLFNLILIIISFNSFSQSRDEFLEEHKTEPIQKIYLHTDRQFYFSGDTIWFAAYLVNGSDHVPVPGNSNLYVELINSGGEVSQSAIFTMFDGFAQGYLPIDYTQLTEGSYILRCFNDYIRNFGEDYFFCSNLKISKTKNSTEFASLTDSGSDQTEIEINFYPEGGFLLAGLVNQVAFKVTGLTNQEDKISGKIINEKGEEVARFSTLYHDMGKLFFAPESNAGYTVKLDDFPDREWKLPPIRSEGAKIVATLVDSAFVNLSVVHSKSEEGNTFHLAVLHRGQGLIFIDLDAGQLDKMIQLSNAYFREGINRIILLNQSFEPVSERLIFRDKLESVNIDLALNKNTFKTRDEVVLHIYDSDELDYNEIAELSVVVVNNDALNTKGVAQNIKSYLLIDSELKGLVADPAGYFTDNEKVSARLKQDLLMLTQGWSNYVWNDLENKKVEINNEGFGLTFSGRLYDKKKQKVISNYIRQII